MQLTSLLIAVVGLALSLGGSVWLWFGLKPDAKRYTDEGMLHPGEQRSVTLPRYIADSRKPTLLVVFGGGVQVLAGILALVSGFVDK